MPPTETTATESTTRLRVVVGESASWPKHELLVEAIALVSGVAPAEVRVAVRCERCGGTGHGKPQVIRPRAAAGPWHASLSRTGTIVAVMVTDAASVGLDIEGVHRVAHAPVDGALLHAGELAPLAALEPELRDRRRTVLWTVKEAVLKASGRGLNVDPRELEVLVGAPTTLSSWPDSLPFRVAPSVATFELTADIVGAAALVDPARVEPAAPIAVEVTWVTARTARS